MARSLGCPDGESVAFCLLCPFFGPAFWCVGLCSRPRFLVALAVWLILVSSLAALLTRFEVTHQVRRRVQPATQLVLSETTTSAPLWCSGIHLQLEAKHPAVRTNTQLAFRAFPSAVVPPVDSSRRLVFDLTRFLKASSAPAGLPLWELDLPLTPNSSVSISFLSRLASFRLTVLRNSANLSCWQQAGNLNSLPASCAVVHSQPVPLNVTLETRGAHAVFYLLFWSVIAQGDFSAEARVRWNSSRYLEPPALPHAGPICRQKAPPNSVMTEVCDLRYIHYEDGYDRRVVVVEMGDFNRTDATLRAACTTHLGNYVTFFLFMPALLWCLVAAALFGYEHFKKCQERRLNPGGENSEGNLDLSTEFRPQRRLTPSQRPDEVSLLLRSLPGYDSNAPR